MRRLRITSGIEKEAESFHVVTDEDRARSRVKARTAQELTQNTQGLGRVGQGRT